MREASATLPAVADSGASCDARQARHDKTKAELEAQLWKQSFLLSTHHRIPRPPQQADQAARPTATTTSGILKRGTNPLQLADSKGARRDRDPAASHLETERHTAVNLKSMYAQRSGWETLEYLTDVGQPMQAHIVRGRRGGGGGLGEKREKLLLEEQRREAFLHERSKETERETSYDV